MIFDYKTILITGGSGSFGQHFVRYLLNIKYGQPKKIIVFSRDELKQYEMQQTFPDDRLKFVIGDVRDKNRLKQAMRDVDYVIHAAALKQVPAAEYNPTEYIHTNIGGAENVVDAALENKVEKVVALSTDKEVQACLLYGATKFAATKLFISANNLGKTQFSVVRYGNVVNSRGSVIPFFMKLRKQENPVVPITDERMTRFWITLDEAVDLVSRSFERMWGGEVFVPKIPSVKVTDLADAILPGAETKIIGIRTGEKLHEVMCPVDTASLTLEFSDHYVIKPTIEFSNDKITGFSTNNLCERGKPVDEDFEYSSKTNPHFLTVDEIRRQLRL